MEFIDVYRSGLIELLPTVPKPPHPGRAPHIKKRLDKPSIKIPGHTPANDEVPPERAQTKSLNALPFWRTDTTPTLAA